jgi:hypothetical protein
MITNPPVNYEHVAALQISEPPVALAVFTDDPCPTAGAYTLLVICGLEVQILSAVLVCGRP